MTVNPRYLNKHENSLLYKGLYGIYCMKVNLTKAKHYENS